MAAFIVLIVYFPHYCFFSSFSILCVCVCVYVYCSPIFGYCNVATFQIHIQLGLIQFQYERPGKTGDTTKMRVSF